MESWRRRCPALVIVVAWAIAASAQDAPDDEMALPVRRGELVTAPAAASAQPAESAEPAEPRPAEAREAPEPGTPKLESARKPAPAKKKPAKASTAKKPAAKASDERGEADRVTAQYGRSVFDQLSVGSAQAPYVLFLYGDLECPDSAQFEAQLLPLLRRDFIDTGRVRLEARAMPLDQHPHAVQAEAAARCAGEQGRYWDMRRMLLASQSDLGTAAINAHAKNLGLDDSPFQRSMKSGRWQEQVVEEKAQGAAAGVARTPTLVLARVQADGSFAHVWTTTEPKDYRALKRQLDRAMGRRFLPF